ncbi:HK97-gp10 family putative phage morphogenesis protein [Facklamia hominis]|uniref:HK97 gp10 family phage protein n=1 Tax=Facklamia hominis CCUG 36813 TaxID=883111 RepID=K1LWJ0_9LACT|nr:HK97-gp10 family putative phage morphogenesis protein [Facklamia hominis]EKB54463.1 HK97 gp10 family phage protein [Facklamia hominis CCUG 36813]
MKVTFKGGTELSAKLMRNAKMEEIKQVVRTNGAELNRGMVRNAVFVKGYSTGATRRSITLNLSNGDMTATVKPGTHYSVYVEYGTRKMAAQPFVKPSFNAQKNKFISDLKRLVQ